jgi:hypothetical protein
LRFSRGFTPTLCTISRLTKPSLFVIREQFHEFQKSPVTFPARLRLFTCIANFLPYLEALLSMKNPKVLMVSATLTSIVVLAAVAIGARDVLVKAHAAASTTDETAAEIIQSQALTEEELAAMQASEAEYAARIEQLNTQIATLNEELIVLQTDGQSNQAQITDYQSQISAANSRIAQFRNAIATMQAREPEWLTQISAARATIAELQAYLATASSQGGAAASSPATSDDDNSGHGGGDDDDDDDNSGHGGGDDDDDGDDDD